MTIEISDSGEPVTAIQLAALEKELGARLPEQYARFIARNNGGVPHPNVVDVEGLPGSPTDVQEFFGVDLEIVGSTVTWHIRELSDRLPTKSLPVACDSGGNLFCVSLAGKHRGSVIYLDMADDAEYHVAEDFDTFLARIHA